ncbi:hypothetical protein FE772_00730 [Lysobacter enzymogenes]|nr:hypothetical protein [Lysobacter enzymogenes]QCW24410.1 hypothetical protein FE772_00730 [Lysobacter enzymogenes]
MDLNPELEKIVAEFEEEFGRLPNVASPEKLFAKFRKWSDRNANSSDDMRLFGMHLAEEGYLPCRNADGSLCFVYLGYEPPRNGERA